jgi:hypothetical protein
VKPATTAIFLPVKARPDARPLTWVAAVDGLQRSSLEWTSRLLKASRVMTHKELWL